MTTPSHPARLFVLLARQASIGVILRRGPTDWIQMIKWHTNTDHFEEGQWFHGRIYEQLSDISPNGKYVTYHAFKPNNAIKNPSYGNRWTALSVPPRFTAVTLWPFHGDDARGGAYFQSNDTLVLNHHQEDNQHYHFKHVPPKNLKVLLPSEWEGTQRERYMNQGTLYLLVGGQLFERRLDRNDWKSENQEGKLESRRNIRGYSLVMSNEWDSDTHKWTPKHPEPSQTWFKVYKGNPITISVSRTRHILKNKRIGFGAIWWRSVQTKLTYDYLLMNRDRTDLYPIENITWADFDQQGRLVLAKEGKLFSATLQNGDLQLTELADFNANKPDPQPAPDWAQKW